MVTTILMDGDGTSWMQSTQIKASMTTALTEKVPSGTVGCTPTRLSFFHLRHILIVNSMGILCYTMDTLYGLNHP